MTQPIAVPPVVASTIREALTVREHQQGLPGMTRTAALVAAELSSAGVTTHDVVRSVAEWHQANPSATRPDGGSTLLAGIWGGRAGRDWAMSYLGAAAPVGPIAAGAAVVAADTGRVLLLQRALDPEDPASGKWEFPGGKIDPGEGAYEAAQREFAEEVGIPLPGKLSGDWISPDGVYHAFVHTVPTEADVPCNVNHEDRAVLNPDDPDGDCIEVVAWWSVDDAEGNPVLRDEVRNTTPWEELRITQAKAAAISDPLPILGRKNGGEVDRLRATSRKLSKVDEELRRKIHAGAEVAMADGLRRAGVKVTQRSAKRSKTLQASVTACDGTYPPAIFAALGITEQEALAHAFDAFRDQADRWITEAQRRKLAILRKDLGLSEEAANKARALWDAAKVAGLGLLVSGLTALAHGRLTGAHPFEEPDGETPVSPLVPMGLVAQAVSAADGRDGMFAQGITHEVLNEQGIVLGVVTDAPVVEHLTWRWNDSEHPFDPHLDRDGTTATAENYQQVWAKPPEEFPYGTQWWAPGDHAGCRCSWDSEFVAQPAPEAMAASLNAER